MRRRSLAENKQREGRKGGEARRGCVCSAEHQYVVTVMSQGRLIASCGQAARHGDGIRGEGELVGDGGGPAGVDVNVARCSVAARRHAGLCTHVCFYTEEP